MQKAGLFSAVVTGFNIQAYPLLQPSPDDPSAAILAQISAQLSSLQINGQTITSTQPPAQVQMTTPFVSTSLIVINALWFTSLILSLFATSVCILLKQWLREYTNLPLPYPEQNLRLRQIRYEGIKRWPLKEIMTLIPLLLQISLILFLVGLIDLVWMLNSTVAIIVTVFVSLILAFTLMTTVLPAFFVSCPYKSPQSRVFFRIWYGVFQPLLQIVVIATIWVADHCPRCIGEPVSRFLVSWSYWYHRYTDLNTCECMILEDLKLPLRARICDTVWTQRPPSDEDTLLMGPFAVMTISADSGPLADEHKSIDDCTAEEKECISTCLRLVAEYYKDTDNHQSMDWDIFGGLAMLLKQPDDNRLAERSWDIIKDNVDRIKLPDSLTLHDGKDRDIIYMRAIFDFITKRLVFHPEAFIPACLAFVKISTQLPSSYFDRHQTAVSEILQLLSGYVSSESPPLSDYGNHWKQLPGQFYADLLNLLSKCLSAVLRLVQEHTEVVNLEHVHAFEDILGVCMMRLDGPRSEIFVYDKELAGLHNRREEVMLVLRQIRELVLQQQNDIRPS